MDDILSLLLVGGAGGVVGKAIDWLYQRWRHGRAEARQVTAVAEKAEAEADKARAEARLGAEEQQVSHYERFVAIVNQHMEQVQKLRESADARSNGLQDEIDKLRKEFREFSDKSITTENELRASLAAAEQRLAEALEKLADALAKIEVLERRLERLANGDGAGKGGAAGIVPE